MTQYKTEMLIPCKIIQEPQNNAFQARAAQLMRAEGTSAPSVSAQPDLLFMRSILVSTGENKNDDVFLPEEMWNARSTPILKPVDWEHNTGRELTAAERLENPKKVVVDNQTIGVMYNAYAIDENGEIIDEAKASASDFEVPKKFHIVDEAVIWKTLYPQTAASIEEGAKNGTLFVSMEAWFPSYSYLVGNKVVARNEETAFLDRTLRANGGNGTYGNDRVRRVLRGLTFGGKGIVARPANAPSVITDVSHEPLSAKASTNKAIANNIICDITDIRDIKRIEEPREDSKMPNENKEQTVALELYTQANEQLVELRAQSKKMEDKAKEDEAKTCALEKQLEDITSAFQAGAEALESVLPGFTSRVQASEPESFFSVLAELIGEQQSQAGEVAEKLEAAKAEIAEAKEQARTAAREAKIDGLLAIAGEAKAEMPPELLEQMKKKKEEKKKKMMAAVQGLADEQFEALYEVWAEEKAEAAEAMKKGAQKEGGKGMKQGSAAPEGSGKPMKRGAYAEEAKGLAEALLNALGMEHGDKAKKEDKKAEGSVLDSIAKAIAGHQEPTDEENFQDILNSVASEDTPPAGEEAQGGLDLNNAYAGLVSQMLPKKDN